MMTPSRDPVCGMVVGGDVGRPASSSALYDGQAYAFCSDVCKQAFLTNPERYVRSALAHMPGHGATMPASPDYVQVGAIAEVHGPVVDIACRYLPPLHQALCAAMHHETYVFEVHQHLNEHHVRAITLHRTSGLTRGLPVFDTGASVQVPVSPECLGRYSMSSGSRWMVAHPSLPRHGRPSSAHPRHSMKPLARVRCWKPGSK